MMIQHPAAPVRHRIATSWCRRLVPAGRLVTMARREIDLRLRIARRELVDLAADLAVASARARVTRSITPDDQIRLVVRYTAQLGQGSAFGSNTPQGPRDREAR